MANVDGTWNVAVKTPLGEQKGVLTVNSNGGSFSGHLSGDLGSKDVAGTVAGDSIEWKMDVTIPMPLSLTCNATVDGDRLTGSVASAYGTFGIAGSRA